jgi:hypothetical protein
VAFNFGCVGRAAACGAVTWFAVLRNFELTKNGPSVGKNRWGRFFLLTASAVLRALYLAGVFLAGVLVGYTIRALISARRRARALRRDRRHDFERS